MLTTVKTANPSIHMRLRAEQPRERPRTNFLGKRSMHDFRCWSEKNVSFNCLYWGLRRLSGTENRANSTKIPSPRKNPAERPTDPGRRGKEGSKGGIKKEPNAQALCRKNLDFFPDDRQTPARREARNHRGEDAEMLGPLPSGPQRTGRAD